jgi:hypothetical protein
MSHFLCHTALMPQFFLFAIRTLVDCNGPDATTLSHRQQAIEYVPEPLLECKDLQKEPEGAAAQEPVAGVEGLPGSSASSAGVQPEEPSAATDSEEDRNENMENEEIDTAAPEKSMGQGRYPKRACSIPG